MGGMDEGSMILPAQIESCSEGGGLQIEEGVSYVAGNTLWAFYQFTVVIVLLSILRARMVNTYHRVFKEADVQWKFFRQVTPFCLPAFSQIAFSSW